MKEKKSLIYFLSAFLLFVVTVSIVGVVFYLNFKPYNDPSIDKDGHDKTIYKINQQGYGNLHTLDTKGEQNILVIPVSFLDYEEKSTEENRKKIETSFFGQTTDTSWESVSSYYNKSSGGKLNLKGKVTDWFNVGINSYELVEKTTTNPEYKYSGEAGTWWLLDEAIEWFESNYDNISSFDNDNDGFYDLVWLVYNVPYSVDVSSSDPYWAFTFWNVENYGTGTARNPSPYLYCWASIDFIFDGYGKRGIDSHTYIHETGHALGLNDYYSTDGSDFPFGCIDMMDFNIGDHCSYSKFLMGWIGPKYVVNEPGTYNLKSAANTGDFLIITDNFNNTPFDEYFVVEYITPTGLNYKDYNSAYPGNNLIGYKKPGIRISHVDARATTLLFTGKNTFTDDFSLMTHLALNNTNTNDDFKDSKTGVYFKENTIMQKDYTSYNSSVLGTKYNPLLASPLFFESDVFSLENGSKYTNLMPSKSNKLNDGSYFNYKIEITSLSEEATITISKI